MFNWNDLRYFLAVARTGSTVAASKAMGVSQSTVQRRLAALEAELDHQLFERHPAGYHITCLGEELMTYAERIEDAVAQLTRHLATMDQELAGVVRVTCPEGLVDALITPLIDRFQLHYPGLKVDLLIAERFVDLSKGEADIAVRAGESARFDPALVCRKICDNPWAVYASSAYIERSGRPGGLEDLDRHAIVDFGGEIGHMHLAKWLRAVAPHATVAARSSTVIGLVMAAKSGAGLTILPVQLGDRESELVRVIDPVPALMSQVYLVFHPDLRNTPRVRAFVDFVLRESAELLPLVRGDMSRLTQG